MNVSLKTMIPATMMALSAMTFASCGSKTEKAVKSKEIKTELPVPFDSANANLPVIDGNRIIYRNTDGDVVSIKNDEGQTLALYKAIKKFSTREKPNITETDKFFTEVSKNIPKTDNLKDTHAINLLHSTILFNELFDLFTEDDSDGGKTITVNEYTHMMDAWSSTGIKE